LLIDNKVTKLKADEKQTRQLYMRIFLSRISKLTNGQLSVRHTSQN